MNQPHRALETVPAQEPAFASLLRFIEQDRQMDGVPAVHVNGVAFSRFDVLCAAALQEIQQSLVSVIHADESDAHNG